MQFLFQSTLPRGERLESGESIATIFDFNPRSHEGSDWTAVPLMSPTFYFNPRSHEGSDWVCRYCCFFLIKISIHAPTRGATLLHVPSKIRKVFQSTLPRGERLQKYTISILYFRIISCTMYKLLPINHNK